MSRKHSSLPAVPDKEPRHGDLIYRPYPDVEPEAAQMLYPLRADDRGAQETWGNRSAITHA